MVLGYFFVRPIPLPPAEEHGHTELNGAEANDDEGQRLLDAEGDGEGNDDGDQIDNPDTL